MGTWWQSKYIEICRLILNNVEEKYPVNAAGHTPLDDARWCFRHGNFTNGKEVIQQLEQLWLNEAEELNDVTQEEIKVSCCFIC